MYEFIILVSRLKNLLRTQTRKWGHYVGENRPLWTDFVVLNWQKVPSRLISLYFTSLCGYHSLHLAPIDTHLGNWWCGPYVDFERLSVLLHHLTPSKAYSSYLAACTFLASWTNWYSLIVLLLLITSFHLLTYQMIAFASSTRTSFLCIVQIVLSLCNFHHVPRSVNGTRILHTS